MSDMNEIMEYDEKYYTVFDDTDYNKDYKTLLNLPTFFDEVSDSEITKLIYKDLYYFPTFYSNLFICITGTIKQIQSVITEDGLKYIASIQVGKFRWLLEGTNDDIKLLTIGNNYTIYGALITNNLVLDPEVNSMVCVPTLKIHKIVEPIEIKEDTTSNKVSWGL